MALSFSASSIKAFISRLPIPFIYGATGWIATEITVVLVPVIPSVIDGYSTVTLASGLLFVAGAVKWIHSELLNLYPSLAGPTVTVASAPAPAAQATARPQGVPADAVQATADSVAYTVAGNGAKTPNVPIGSWVFNEGNGWFDVYDASGALLAKTRISPLAS